MSTTGIGNKGEDIACHYLQKLGFKILERNFRIRGGEIDIIARDSNELVFVEVKTRYSHEFGPPLEAITPWKIRYLIKAAQFYMLKHNQENSLYRLDAVAVDFADSADKPQIELIKNITS